MSAPDDLTALAHLADLVAYDLLLNCPPDDWPGSAVFAGVRDAGRRLREAGRMLPASLIEIMDRADCARSRGPPGESWSGAFRVWNRPSPRPLT